MDRLAEPEDPHGLTSWGLTALEATVLPREANFRTKCLNFLHFLQKMPFVHFPASKKPIQLHTQIMVEMAPEIGHRDTSQIISSNVKDTTQYIGTNLNQPHCRCTVVLACTHSKYIYISMFVLNVPKKKRERNCVFCVPTALLSFQRPCLSERQETVVVLQILVFAYYFGTHRWQLPGMYSHNLSGS